MIQELKQCDALRVTVLVDNVSDLLSTTPSSVTSHLANLKKGEGWRATGSCLCCANWGLSLALDIEVEGNVSRILFDAGPDRQTLRRNADLLGYDMAEIDAVVLSHGHWDHAGGLLEAFDGLDRTTIRGPTEFHANEGMFVARGLRTPTGSVIPFLDPPNPAALGDAGAHVILGDDARSLLDGRAYLGGEIPRLTDYEVGLPGHLSWDDFASDWRDDPLIKDERWLAVHVRDKGIVVFTACSHAGLVNVLLHAREVFAPAPLFAVMGGFHLSGPENEKIIGETVRDLAQFNLAQIIPGHCTGWRAVAALAAAFGERVTPSAVGQSHAF